MCLSLMTRWWLVGRLAEAGYQRLVTRMRGSAQERALKERRAKIVKIVLLLGVKATVLEDARRELQMPNTEFLIGTGVADIKPAFRQADIDHVIMGGGLDIDTRAAILREVFHSSDRATAHMKDQMSGPEGFVPFVRAVLTGLADYAPSQSSQAVLRAQPPGSDAR